MHDLSRSWIMLAAALALLLAMITVSSSAQSVVYGGDGRTLDSNQAALRDLVLKHAGAWAKPDRADLDSVLASDVLFAYPAAKLDKAATLNAFDAFVQQYNRTTVVIPNGGIIIDSEVGRVSVQWKFSTYARSTGVRQVVNAVSVGKVRTTAGTRQFVEWLEFVDGQVPALQAAGVLSYEDGADAVVKPWPAFVPGREQCKAVVKASCPLPSYTDGKIHWDLIAATGQKPPAYFDSVGVYDSASGVFYMNGGLMDSTSVTQAKLSNSTFALNVESQEWFELTSIGGPSARCDATLAMGSSSNLVRVIGGRGAFRTPDPKNPGQFIDTIQHNEYVYNAASGAWTEIPLRQAEADLVGRAAAHRFERTDPVTAGERQTCIFGGLGNTLPRWFSLPRGVFADIICHTPTQGWRVVEPAPGSPVPLGRAWANHAYLPEIDVLLVHAGFGNQSQNTSVSPDPSLPLDWVDSNVYDDLWAFDFATRVWTRLNLAGPHPRERSGGVGVWDPLHKAMVIFGGYDFFGNGTSDFWALNVNLSNLHASHWENLSPRVEGSIPVGRIGAAHFSRVTPEGFEIWIIGGADKDARFNVPPSADIYRVIIPKDLPAPQTPTDDFDFYSGTSAWWMAVTIPGSQSVSIDCGNGQGLTQMTPAWMPNMWTFTSTNGQACGSSLTFVVNGGAAQTMTSPWA